jgi:hypothetical protein
MRHPTGKAAFIWELKATAGGDPLALVAKAAAAKFDWVAIKISNGTATFQANLLPLAIDLLRDAGISVWGWSYVYGINSLMQNQGKREAELAADLMLRYNLDGFLIDAEREWKRPGGAKAAEDFSIALRTRLPTTPIGLCASRFPSVHPEFPWRPFLQICDFHCPMVYWQGAHNPAEQLARSVKELQLLKDIPVVPVGAAYYESGWQPTVAEINLFNAKAKSMGLPGVIWWSWQAAENHPDFWAAIAAHEWGPPAPPGPLFRELAWIQAQEELQRWGIKLGMLTTDGRLKGV